MGTDFAAVGRLLRSPARAAMLEALLDGGTASASELAAAASVKPSTASGHLAVLVEGRMIEVRGARAQRRNFARACLDSTERRPHLAGALGAALCQSVLRAGWARRRRSGRGLLITPLGAAQFTEFLGIATTPQ
jgi:DNA-binding transcriptional ArsR family regulator